MILLKKGSSGNPALKDWKVEIVCGEHAYGCGAELSVEFKDIFKHAESNSYGSGITYRSKCPCCHQDVMIPHEGVPFEPEDVIERPAWLRFKRNALLMQLAEETPASRHAELHDALTEDGIECTLLSKLFAAELQKG